MINVQFKLHPPAQPSSWAIRVSQGSSKLVKIKSKPRSELAPEHYIFHPKHFLNDDPEPQIIFLKTPYTVNSEDEQTQDELVVSNLEPKNNDQAKEDGHDLANEDFIKPQNTFPGKSHQSENIVELPIQFESVSDAQKNLQPKNNDLLKNKKINSRNVSKKEVLTTMIEQILSDSENSSDDMTSGSENHNIQEKQKQVCNGEIRNSLTNKKSKQPFQRALAEDFFFINIDEDLSPVPAKKSRNASYSQPKLVHPICAVPGKTWNNHLSSYNIKKLNNLPSKDMQISKNGKEDNKIVDAATVNDAKQNKTICEMEFLTKKVSRKQLFQNSSSNPVDDQIMSASTSSDWQLPDYHENPKQSAPMQGRAVKWVDKNNSSLGNNQLNNYQQIYNKPSVLRLPHESFSQTRSFNSSTNSQENRPFYYNSSFYSTQQPSLMPPCLPPPPFSFFNDHQNNRQNYPQRNTFSRNKFKKQKNTSMQQESLPKLRICPQTFNFYLNGQVQVDNVLCSGILKHFLAKMACFEKEFIVNVVHLGPAYQEDHRNIFLNSAWREFGLNVESLMKISEVIPKLLLCSNHELVIAILKPDSDNFSSNMNCYTALFNHLDARACTGVFSYEHRVDICRKQKAYVYPLSKEKTLPSEIEMFLSDAFPPIDCRPNLLLMIVLIESAKI